MSLFSVSMLYSAESSLVLTRISKNIWLSAHYQLSFACSVKFRILATVKGWMDSWSILPTTILIAVFWDCCRMNAPRSPFHINHFHSGQKSTMQCSRISSGDWQTWTSRGVSRPIRHSSTHGSQISRKISINTVSFQKAFTTTCDWCNRPVCKRTISL